MSDLDCPYCGAEIDICNDDGHGLNEDQIYQEQCPECEKHFVFTSYITISYTPEKAGCLNGSEHKWKEKQTYPREYTRLCCEDCGEEKPLKKRI